jgi:hypothetical protein
MVSQFLLSKVTELNKTQQQVTEVDFNSLFKLSKDCINSHVAQTYKHKGNETDLLGTTTIALFEFENKISVGYVGNGAIWHIRGNVNEFPDSIPHPWNMVNYLNPHSIYDNGKEIMYRSISNGRDYDECIPTTLSVNKDNLVGDIFMICSDGIYSADQARIGRTEKGMWLKLEKTMLVFICHLKEYLSRKAFSNNTLKDMLNKYLQEIEPMLNDDAAIGMIITSETIRHQLEQNTQTDGS